MATAAARPPGVYFDFVERQVHQQPRRRSDVAGFVGLTMLSKPRRAILLECPDEEKANFPLQVRRCDRLEDFYDSFERVQEIPQQSATDSDDGDEPAFVPRQRSYLEAAVRGFFANGGQTCFVAPGEIPFAKCKDPCAALVESFKQAIGNLRDIDAVSLLVVPGAGDMSLPNATEIWREMIFQAETLGDRTALLDPPVDFNPERDIDEHFVRPPSGLAALYWPWITVATQRPDAVGSDAAAWAVPPCGHIAGTIARRDLSRGVFAPPANIVIEGALGVTNELSAADRESVNENGVNVIVAVPGRGVRAMGARTLLPVPPPAGDGDLLRTATSRMIDPYRWLNVRRLVAHLAEWIAEETQWSVFEPQGEVLYRAIERSVRTILFDLWRRGGLVGATDDEAYFVRCDATTNPPDQAEQGRVVCVVGLRPAVPAEMIVVRIGVAEGRVELLDREFGDA